jgi:hypothetical protein
MDPDTRGAIIASAMTITIFAAGMVIHYYVGFNPALSYLSMH